MLDTRIGRVEIQTEMLEKWLGTLDSELDIDMKPGPAIAGRLTRS